MERNSEALPVKETDLAPYNSEADGLIAKVTYAPKAMPAKQSDTGGPRMMESSLRPPQEAKDASIFKAVSKIGGSVVLPEKVNHVLRIVWQGIRIGSYLASLYEKSANLDEMKSSNSRGQLPRDQSGQLRDKVQTAAAIKVFAAAYYAMWELSRMDGVDSKVEIPGLPETNYANPLDAMKCTLYHYWELIDNSDIVRTEDDFVRVTLLYFRQIVDDIKAREGSFLYHEPFTSRNYRLEKSEFGIHGFVAETASAAASVEFRRQDINEIVGNRAAKRQARLLAQRLMAYDFATKRNPFMDLGGLTTVRMGFGPPGTGKSMLIAAIATMLGDWCAALKYPFVFRPFPDNAVSTFQGGSAENILNWFRQFHDPTKIYYGPIDDGEVVLEDRTRHNVSAGVREIIGVFLRMTEGAYAINYGNYVLDVFTNLPDTIDKAVLSRIVSRFLIAGAETKTDFIDQDYGWWKRYEAHQKGFVNMEDDPKHRYMEAQAMIKRLGDVHERYTEPQDERMNRIFSAVRKQNNTKNHGFFGALYEAVRKEFPFFTSRDVRNIQKAVDGRVMDFELPDEWIEHPDQFYLKGYDEKKQILVSYMRDSMGTLSFVEVRLQETVMYLDEMMRIADVTRARRLDELVDNLVMQLEGRMRLAQLQKEGKAPGGG